VGGFSLTGNVGLLEVMLLSAALFAVGLYGAISKKSTIGILMSLEVMAVAVTVNLIGIARWINPTEMEGWFFAAFLMVVSAAEVAIGLALVIAIFRAVRTSEVADMDELKG